MTFAEFAEISTEQQMDAIWEWGFYVGKSSEKNSIHVLYSLNGFFVEVLMDKETASVIETRAYHLLDDTLLKRYGLSLSNPFIRAGDGIY